MCHLLALIGANHIFHVSRIRVKGHRVIFVNGQIVKPKRTFEIEIQKETKV